MKKKSELCQIFQTLHPLLEKQLGHKILNLYTDGGGEFQSLIPYLQRQGIQHFTSPPYTPQRIAIAERRHRHIIQTAKTLLHAASMPSHFWTFACLHATYLINRMPSSILHYKSPFELLFNSQPNFTHIRTFGCLLPPGYVLMPITNSNLAPHHVSILDSQKLITRIFVLIQNGPSYTYPKM